MATRKPKEYKFTVTNFGPSRQLQMAREYLFITKNESRTLCLTTSQAKQLRKYPMVKVIKVKKAKKGDK